MSHKMSGVLLSVVVVSTTSIETVVAGLKINLDGPAKGFLRITEFFAGNTLGQFLGGAGDINGDGFDDVLIACPYGLNRIANSDKACTLILFGRRGWGGDFLPGDPGETVSIIWGYGGPCGVVGDINSDGYCDFVISNSDQGALLIYGAADFPGEVPTGRIVDFFDFTELSGRSQGNSLQVSEVKPAGDFNGDGFNDFIIGLPFFKNEGKSVGRAIVIFGSTYLGESVDLVSPMPDQALVLEGSLVGEGLGRSVAGNGDVNGDGFPDIVVYADFYFQPMIPARLYIVYGSKELPAFLKSDNLSPHGVTVLGDAVCTSVEVPGLGSVTVDGDLNGDGLCDVVLGQGDTKISYDFGRVVVIPGSPDLPPTLDLSVPANVWKVEVNREYGSFGYMVSYLGDIDGDGRSDLAVGAPGFEGGKGAVLVFRGAQTASELHPLVGEPEIIAVGADVQDFVGKNLARAGDFNGDSVPDLLLSAPDFQEAENPELSVAYVVFGVREGMPLQVFYVEPQWGPITGGTEVHIYGTGFTHEIRVYFGKKEAPSVSVTGPGEIIVRTPKGDGFGTVDVQVRSTDLSASLTAGFRYTIDRVEFDSAKLLQATIFPRDTDVWGTVKPVAAGDMSGDGIPDLLVETLNVQRAGAGLSFYRRAWVWIDNVADISGEVRIEDLEGQYGTLALPETPGTEWPAAFSFYGLGDVNGDGIYDVGVVDPYFPLGPSVVGRAFILYGMPEGVFQDLEGLLLTVQNTSITNTFGSPGRFGLLRMSAGDFNGDGLTDTALGIGGGSLPVFVLFGTRQILQRVSTEEIGSSVPGVRIEPGAEDDFFGESVSFCGDINGDGCEELVLRPRSRWLYIVKGGLPPGLYSISELESSQLAWRIENKTFGGGFRCRRIGDITGDGIDDLLLADPNAAISSGLAAVFAGGPNLTESLQTKTLLPDSIKTFGLLMRHSRQWTGLGTVVVSGDFDADGVTDLAISAPGPGKPGEGRLGTLWVLRAPKTLSGEVDFRNPPGDLAAALRGPEADDRFGSSALYIPVPGGPGLFAVEADYAWPVGPVANGRLYFVRNPFAKEPGRFVRGDVNADGKADIGDAVACLAFLFGGAELRCQDAADINDDGVLNIADPITLLTYLFGGGPEPPAPFPGEGTDPTEDELTCRW